MSRIAAPIDSVLTAPLPSMFYVFRRLSADAREGGATTETISQKEKRMKKLPIHRFLPSPQRLPTCDKTDRQGAEEERPAEADRYLLEPWRRRPKSSMARRSCVLRDRYSARTSRHLIAGRSRWKLDQRR